MLKMLEVQLDTGRGLGSWRSSEALKDFKLKEILLLCGRPGEDLVWTKCVDKRGESEG